MQNVWGINLISRDGGTKVYMLYNGHKDVTALVDGTGVIVGTYYYDAFGVVLSKTGTNDNPYGYSGYEYDEETGLYYLKARFYDPATARFLQEDSYTGDTSDPLSLNLYTYCSNNPIIYWDYTGNWQAGDEKRDAATQAVIASATEEYDEAARKGDKAGMDAAHKKAEDARKGEYKEFEHKRKATGLQYEVNTILNSKFVEESAKESLKNSVMSAFVEQTWIISKPVQNVVENINKGINAINLKVIDHKFDQVNAAEYDIKFVFEFVGYVLPPNILKENDDVTLFSDKTFQLYFNKTLLVLKTAREKSSDGIITNITPLDMKKIGFTQNSDTYSNVASSYYGLRLTGGWNEAVNNYNDTSIFEQFYEDYGFMFK